MPSNPMETMTFEDFQHLLEGPRKDYYEGRWDYYETVISMAIRVKPRSVLELGPGEYTIVDGSDVMVIPEDDIMLKVTAKTGNPLEKPLNPIGRIYAHNATEKPWPIADKQYDLFIALQVWEHLDNKQCRAFREVMRVSKSAILSFPFLWNCKKSSPSYPHHHMIDEDLIADWTLNIKPIEVVTLPKAGLKGSNRQRIIYLWEF